MVEITSEEQNKVKRMKRAEGKQSQRPLGQSQTHEHLNYIDLRKEEENKGYEEIFEEIIVENFPNAEKEIVNQVQEVQSPTHDKAKEKHTKTHTNQTNKD